MDADARRDEDERFRRNLAKRERRAARLAKKRIEQGLDQKKPDDAVVRLPVHPRRDVTDAELDTFFSRKVFTDERVESRMSLALLQHGFRKSVQQFAHYSTRLLRVEFDGTSRAALCAKHEDDASTLVPSQKDTVKKGKTETGITRVIVELFRHARRERTAV